MRLGELQLRILKVLWRSAPATVSEVRDQLDGDELAYTTVATMLRKMESRQLVRHTAEGRKFHYHPLVTESEVSRNMSDDLVERLFEGSLTQAVTHL
ncbi:MAG: BlaI/MecI/CopY family transcriptional regulator, partial [Pirellulaceae bacterium]|nr:BlaI/MecI/CopY family transcriptional regulator [Pirellulaceae bacterium]